MYITNLVYFSYYTQKVGNSGINGYSSFPAKKLPLVGLDLGTSGLAVLQSTAVSSSYVTNGPVTPLHLINTPFDFFTQI